MSFILKAVVAFVICHILALILYPIAIPILHKMKFGQHVRDDIPEEHRLKEGTPTMGGILFVLIPLIVCSLLQINAFKDFNYLITLLGFIGFGLIGFLDDYLIIFKKRAIGLKTLEKLALQIILSLIIYFIYRYSSVYSSIITLPFSKLRIDCGWFFGVIVFFMFAGETNAVNVTDGLDGLCAGLMMFALVPFFIYCFKEGLVFNYVLIAGLMGALLGYLKYNKHPAKIFMGDSGSLALGGILAATALITKQELALLIVGGVFLIEIITCAIQIYGIRVHHGKRYFKMAPIHHHFEKCGMSETKVVKMFYICGIVLSIVGIVIAFI